MNNNSHLSKKSEQRSDTKSQKAQRKSQLFERGQDKELTGSTQFYQSSKNMGEAMVKAMKQEQTKVDRGKSHMRPSVNSTQFTINKHYSSKFEQHFQPSSVSKGTDSNRALPQKSKVEFPPIEKTVPDKASKKFVTRDLRKHQQKHFFPTPLNQHSERDSRDGGFKKEGAYQDQVNNYANTYQDSRKRGRLHSEDQSSQKNEKNSYNYENEAECYKQEGDQQFERGP